MTTARDIYNQLKIMLTGCRHISDAYEISSMFVKEYPEHRELIVSIINGKHYYDSTISIKSIKSTISDINMARYIDDVTTIIDNVCEGKVISDIQRRTFLKLSKSKVSNPSLKESRNTDTSTGYETKNCPHCNHPRKDTKYTNYVICGYHESVQGMEKQGCGKDWCFTCGKMLCKNWADDSLFLETNRFHERSCCMQYALDNKKDYLKDFCHCLNTHVNRTSIIDELENELAIDIDMSTASLSDDKN